MSFSRRLSVGALCVGAVLASPVPQSWATVGPPVEIKMPADTVQAVSGQEYHGVFEIHVYRAGAVENIQISGDGWDVRSVDIPATAANASVGAVRVPFVAVPADADRPIRLTATYNGRRVSRAYEIGPAYFSRRDNPRRSMRIPNMSGVRPGAEPHGGSDGSDGGDSGTSSASGGTLAIAGRIVFTRPDGELVGADRLSVALRDIDPLGGYQVLWSGSTDELGYFDGDGIPTDVDDDGSGPDLVLVFGTISSWVDVTDNSVLESTYVWYTEEITDFEGSFFDFGWTTPADNGTHAALHIFNTLTRARRYVAELDGYTPDQVQVEWPVEEWTHYEAEPKEIHINPLHEWEEFAIIHEYGHHFMHYYGNPPDTDYCNGTCDDDPPSDCGHCVWCEENIYDAFNEGFPNWMADVITRAFADRYEFEPGVPYEPFLELTIETETPQTCDGDFDSITDTEGFIGALLRDIEDDTQDDHDGDGIFDLMCMGAGPNFQVLVEDHPITIVEFIVAMLNRFPSDVDDFWPTAYNVGGAFYTLDFPNDAENPGAVSTLDSPTHPLGTGDSLSCVEFAWESAPDDARGANEYSYYLHQEPGGIEPDNDADSVAPGDDCTIRAKYPASEVGDWYLSIKARDNAGNWSDVWTTFGPFEVTDCNNSGLLDICDIDCNHTGTPGGGICEFALSPCTGLEGCGQSSDCNSNLRPDECDIVDGTSEDCDVNGVPDECQPMKHWDTDVDPPEGYDWGLPVNWAEGAIPQDGDDVCIAAGSGGATVIYREDDTSLNSLASGLNFIINGSSSPWPDLVLDENSFILEDFEMSGNSSTNLTINERLYVDGMFYWKGGNIRGNGVTEVNGGLSLTQSSVALFNGDFRLTGGEGRSDGPRITFYNGATFEVGTQATYEYEGDSYLFDGGTTTLVDVRGELTRSAGDGTATVFAPLTNSGVIRAQSGEFSLARSTTHTGQLLGDPGVNVVIGSTYATSHEFGPTSSIDVHSVEFGGGTGNIHGTVDITDTLAVTGGTTNFADDLNYVSYGQHLYSEQGRVNFYGPTDRAISFETVTITTPGQSAGTVDFSTGQPVDVGTFTMVTGGLHGASPVNVSGSFNWTRGTIWDGGTITADGPVIFNPTSSNRTIRRVVNIKDQATIRAGFGMSGPGRINIFDSVSCELQFNSGGIGSGIISNEGTILRSSGDGQISVSANVLNNGLIRNQTGTLNLNGGGTHTGDLVADAGSILILGGTHEFLPDSSLTADHVQVAGNGTSSGAVNIAGTLETDGANWTFTEEADVASYGQHFDLGPGTVRFESLHDEPVAVDTITIGVPFSGGATVHFDTNQPFHVNELTLNSGASIEGANQVRINEQLTWNQGSLNSGGAVNCYGDSTINATSSARYLYRPFNNHGTMTFFGAVAISPSGPLNNMPDGVIDLRFEDAGLSGGGVINNAGTIVKAVGDGDTGMQDLVNTGTFDVQTGSISFNTSHYAFTQTAGETILNDTVLNMYGGNPTVALNGGLLRGNGSVIGRLHNSGGTVTPGFSLGQLHVDGEFEQGEGATLEIEIAGSGDGEYDVLSVTGNAQLAGTLSVTDLQGFVPGEGDTFAILTADSVSGQFDALSMPAHYQVQYNPTNVTLVASIPLADLNGDGQINLRDYGVFQVCFNGTGQPPAAACPAEVDADLDTDGDVDLDDYAIFFAAASQAL